MAIQNVTLNPSDMNGAIALSNGNLTVTATAGISGNIRATHGKTKGKWYWEVKLDSGAIPLYIGISNKIVPITTSPLYNDANGRFYYTNNGYKYPGNLTYGTTWAVGNVIGIALDMDNFRLEFYKNGVSMGVSHTDLAGLGEVFPTIIDGTTTTKTFTVNFGKTPFAYPIPVGFKSYVEDGFVNKILISSSNGFSSIKEKTSNGRLMIPQMSSNTNGNISVTSNPEGGNSANYSPFKALDRGSTTSSLYLTSPTAGGSGWITIYLPDNTDIPYSYRLTGFITGTSNLSLAPQSWNLYGSNDNVTFDLLDAQTNVTNWIADEVKEFKIDVSVPHKYYKIEVTKSGESRISIPEFNIVASESTEKYVILGDSSESAFLNYGFDKTAILDLSKKMINKTFIKQSSTTLGSGKVFKKSIDTSKIPIKKVSIN